MPICKQCTHKFPIATIIDGKKKILKSRSYCLNCSPFKSKFGQTIKSKNNIKVCLECGKESPWNKNNVCSTCRKIKLRHKHKLKGIKILGGHCKKCNESNPLCLTFHHLDPNEKDFDLCQSWGTKKWDVLEKEIKKCCLLCANCHMIEHTSEKIKLLYSKRFHGETGSTQQT